MTAHLQSATKVLSHALECANSHDCPSNRELLNDATTLFFDLTFKQTPMGQYTAKDLATEKYKVFTLGELLQIRYNPARESVWGRMQGSPEIKVPSFTFTVTRYGDAVIDTREEL